jgi:hypothetical protein
VDAPVAQDVEQHREDAVLDGAVPRRGERGVLPLDGGDLAFGVLPRREQR